MVSIILTGLTTEGEEAICKYDSQPVPNRVVRDMAKRKWREERFFTSMTPMVHCSRIVPTDGDYSSIKRHFGTMTESLLLLYEKKLRDFGVRRGVDFTVEVRYE